jgi:ferredoxin
MPKIKFGSSGPEVIVPAGSELVQIYNTNETLPLKFGCRRGDCGTCAIKVLDGYNNLTKISPTEEIVLKKKNLNPDCHRLACQCALNGDVCIEKVN